MHKFFSVLFICLFAILVPSFAIASPERLTDLKDIDSYILEQMQRSSIPGVSYAIIEKGSIVHLGAFGIANPAGQAMTPQTPLYIGSVGKTFTALAVRQLVNAGKLDLNTPVITYLPNFTLADMGAARQITIRQLLDHTSGFSNQDGNDPIFYQTDASNEELVRLLATYKLNRPIGVSAEYSNINYIILGQVIAVVSGMPYEDYVRQFIFSPLEMHHSFAVERQALQDGLSAGYRYYFGLPVAVNLDEPQGAIAAGFLMTSAEDMAHYLVAFTDNGQYNGVSVVNPGGQPSSEDLQLTYNIDWLNQNEASRPSNTEAHSGGWLNYSAGIAFMPTEKIGVVVLANSFPAQWLPVKDAFALTYDVLRMYTGSSPNPPTPPLIILALVVDGILLAMAGFVAFRFVTLRRWRQRLTQSGRGIRAWLPSFLIDLLLPLFVLGVLPELLLASTGHLNPIWCWNRLAFQVPDITWAVLIMTCVLLLVGLVKSWIYATKSNWR